MYKKFATLFLLGTVCLSFGACNKDSEITSVMADINAATEEIVKKVDASPTVAGVDEAQKYFDSKKSDLKGKWDSIKGARGFQVSEETKKSMIASYTKDYTAIKSLEIRHMGVSIRDDEFKTKLEKLVKDWEDTFKAE